MSTPHLVEKLFGQDAVFCVSVLSNSTANTWRARENSSPARMKFFIVPCFLFGKTPPF